MVVDYFTVIMKKVVVCKNIVFHIFSNLRIDSLAQILTQGNIRAGMTVGVVDSCIGLVTGAVLERLGGEYETI